MGQYVNVGEEKERRDNAVYHFAKRDLACCPSADNDGVTILNLLFPLPVDTLTNVDTGREDRACWVRRKNMLCSATMQEYLWNCCSLQLHFGCFSKASPICHLFLSVPITQAQRSSYCFTSRESYFNWGWSPAEKYSFYELDQKSNHPSARKMYGGDSLFRVGIPFSMRNLAQRN